MIIVITEKGKTLQNINDPIVLSGIGRLLRENPGQAIVGFEDLINPRRSEQLSSLLHSEVGEKESVNIYISVRGHGAPGIIEGWVVADEESKMEAGEVAIDTVLASALRTYASKISGVTIYSCSGGINEPPRRSIQLGVLKAMLNIGVREDVPVIAYNGYTVSPPNPGEPVVIVRPITDPCRQTNSADFERRVAEIQYGIDGRKHTGLLAAERYLSLRRRLDSQGNIGIKAARVNEILEKTKDPVYRGEPFFTAFIRYAIRETGAELVDNPINVRTIAQFVKENPEEKIVQRERPGFH